MGQVMLVDWECVPWDAEVGMDTIPQYAVDAVFKEAPSLEGIRPPRNYTKPEAIHKWWAQKQAGFIEELQAHQVEQHASAKKYWEDQSKRPMTCKVVCAGYKFLGEEPQVLYSADDELSVLTRLEEIIVGSQSTVFVAHNGLGYDFPVMQLRGMKHKLFTLSKRFYQEKPWSGKLVDTMKLWPGTRRGYVKLSEVMRFLDVDISENPFDGSQVLPAFLRGDHEIIQKHALEDLKELEIAYKCLKLIGIC